MENPQDNKDDHILPYLPRLRSIKTIHTPIKIIVDKYMKVIEEFEGPIKENMDSVVSFKKEIKNELFDPSFGDIYPDSSLNKMFPLYENAQKNFNTRQDKLIQKFVEFIIEIIEIANEIKETIREVPIKQEEPIKSEAEKKAFENKQQSDMMLLEDKKKIENKADFNLVKNNIMKRAETDEERILTDNIALKIFGKKIGDVEWNIGRKKKTTN